MKSVITLFGTLCVIIASLVVIGGFIKGFVSVLGLFPEWVWIILFLGIVCFFVKKEEQSDKEANEAFKKRMDEKKS